MDARRPVSNFRLTTPQPLWDILLVCAFLIGAFSAIWFPDHWQPKCFFGLTLIAMAMRSWSTPASSSLSGKHRRRDEWARMMVLTMFAVILMYLVCRWTGAFHGLKLFEIDDKSWGHWITVKLPTVIGQQIMLQILLAPILLSLFQKTNVAAFVGALIFGLLHLPNPLLVTLTFVAGMFWISAYYRTRQLTPILVSHFVLAILAAGFCGEYVFNMRVGPGCFALFPQQITSGADAKYEFPGCIIGCAERLVQKGDELTVVGWALDPIHNTSPTVLFLMVDGQLEEISQVQFERVPASHWVRASRSGFVGDVCYSFVARIPTSRTRSINPVKLFAANANGHLGKLGQMGDIVALEGAPTERPIVVFPVEVDGRVNQVVRRPDGLHLRGWAADLRGRSLPEKLVLNYDGQLRSVDLRSNRHSRPDIANSLKEPVYEQAGFDIDLGPISIFYLQDLQCFAVDQRQHLHPIQLTDQAETSVARLINGINGDTILR